MRSEKRSPSILFTSKSVVVAFFRDCFFKFSACTEYGNLKPITWMSLFSERGIVFHVNYCYVGFDMRTMDQAAFSKAEQDASFRLQMDITSSLWNFRRVEPGGRERLCCFPLFAHDRLTSHSNESKLCLAWLAVKKGNVYFANYRFSFLPR